MDEGYKKAKRRIQPAIAEKSVELDLSWLELTGVSPKSHRKELYYEV